jgi:hypothetical protein
VRLNICRRLPQLRLGLRIRFRLIRGAVAGSLVVLIHMSEYIRKLSKRFCVSADKIVIEGVSISVSSVPALTRRDIWPLVYAQYIVHLDSVHVVGYSDLIARRVPGLSSITSCTIQHACWTASAHSQRIGRNLILMCASVDSDCGPKYS